MEPENHLSEKGNHLPNLQFWLQNPTFPGRILAKKNGSQQKHLPIIAVTVPESRGRAPCSAPCASVGI